MVLHKFVDEAGHFIGLFHRHQMAGVGYSDDFGIGQAGVYLPHGGRMESVGVFTAHNEQGRAKLSQVTP